MCVYKYPIGRTYTGKLSREDANYLKQRFLPVRAAIGNLSRVVLSSISEEQRRDSEKVNLNIKANCLDDV